LKPAVDDWWLVTLDSERGLGSTELATRLGHQVEVKQHFERIDNALDHALSSLTNHDIMLVTGSFVTVELLLRALSDSGDLSGDLSGD
jgi:folylpolyglutamate synthase/dihydropteroate synthase